MIPSAAEDLRRGEVRYVADALRSMPGVAVGRTGTVGEAKLLAPDVLGIAVDLEAPAVSRVASPGAAQLDAMEGRVAIADPGAPSPPSSSVNAAAARRGDRA